MTGGGNSRRVTSSQQGCHQQLAAHVTRHLRMPFRKPYAEHSLTAWYDIQSWLMDAPGPLLLDACCGVGESTRKLAELYPQARVLGVDKSAHRLAKGSAPAQDNFRLLRADLVDIWRLCFDHGVQFARQYILYPNPWPKPGHLNRRWHAHAVFPYIVAAGGTLTVRSNWPVYVQEFAAALALAGQGEPRVEPYQAPEPLTPFERKYWASGQQSWQLQLPLQHYEVPA